MTTNQWGLLFDICGVLLLGCDSFMKLSFVGPGSIMIGYGDWNLFWKLSGISGYIGLLIGFILQFIGSCN